MDLYADTQHREEAKQGAHTVSARYTAVEWGRGRERFGW